ncbi:MAG: hypothetical protein CVU42_11920 [Chloroflexi bacterium HGW-Chloroflexi-4]|nr:MAG: hypothetical protein CVU42_11920 [Chloroflexi bacterium HGW-Chloroflexi-4]
MKSRNHYIDEELLNKYFSNMDVATWRGKPFYLNIPPFNPSFVYPEYKLTTISEIENPAYEGVRSCLFNLNLDKNNYGTPNWNPLRGIINKGNTVLIKPNFVVDKHARNGNIFSIITHPSMIRAIVDYCYYALDGQGKIVIADSPQMDCDFNNLLNITNLFSIQDFFKTNFNFDIEIIDLRDFWFKEENGNKIAYSSNRIKLKGDPVGSSVINLGRKSAFEGLPNLKKIYGADYDRTETISHHHDDIQEYVLSNSVLQADVLISIPKLKVHKKVGVTLNSKGFVGTITNKNCLIHYTIGTPKQGGDQYPAGILSYKDKLLVNSNNKLYDLLLAKNSHFHQKLYSYLLFVYRSIIKPILRSSDKEKSIIDAGNWHGNDSAWRMVVDLSQILFYSDHHGRLQTTPQRKIFSIIDGIVGGEKDGPLLPDEKLSGTIIAGFNPIATDIVSAAIMGLNYKKLKWVNHLLDSEFFVDLSKIQIFGEEHFRSILSSPVNSLQFTPHIGWQNYLEKFEIIDNASDNSLIPKNNL